MMEVGGEAEAAIRPWNVLVLASFAPLGAFPDVRLSPRLTRQDLGVAAGLVFPRAPGELLVATVGEGPAPALLTTHRIIWFERVEAAPGGPAGARAMFNGRAAAYEDVGHDAAPSSASGTPGLDLGRGVVVPMPGAPPGLVDALATALRSLALAARTGEAPAVDPELARRVAEALPKVVVVDANLRAFGEHKAQFRDDLFAATPMAFVTRAMFAACVLVYVAMVARGVDPMSPSLEDLLAWGANDAVRVTLRGEPWRLPASVFLHGGLFHLAMNMWCLMNVGPLVERLYGNVRFAAVYLAAGVGGAVASMAVPPARVSVGASGAIFGVLGALLAFLLVRRRAVPPTVLASLRSSGLSFVAFNTVFGAVATGIDQAAHLGGLATGFLAGLVLAPAWPRKADAGGLARSAALAALVTVAVIGLGAGAVRWRAATISPADRFQDFAIQFQPVYERFRETADGNREIFALLKANDEAERKSRFPELLARLEREGRTNLVEVARLWTPEPRLAEVARLLASAQRQQVAGVEAVRRFRESGDRDWIEGPEGFLARAADMARLEKDWGDRERAFVRENGGGGAEEPAEDGPEP
ncbi:rhomboid family intramembrane serine protease [Paludisphaera mucosa]|uniref:Rhomboid family intramembrane serine protease n=1 Tax=Paludisphaera mucosa TaxID=3030827 RepID=A0ABT6FHF0_9BACT|nr:rhomboid family intramembrane serine protease [Paludisphaera mucosa]MDG3006911.1 rhomboid family intramembrane serine protease [Paludisphaera mucosa]